jgi:CopG family transcriptional regulator, nickel-responsive regulator
MAIVCVSIGDKLLKEADSLQDELGFSGRSEVLRAGLRALIAESREAKPAKGRIKSVLLVVHGRESEGKVAEASHGFADIITAQMHSDLKGKCLEIFIIDGEASRVRKFYGAARSNKDVSYAKLVTP